MARQRRRRVHAGVFAEVCPGGRLFQLPFHQHAQVGLCPPGHGGAGGKRGDGALAVAPPLKNPTARFEVQGHTDNQGSDKINDPLSQQRAEAVVKALEGLGCDGFNLRAVGKGSHEPVADNKTDEGRAKNRRVEFIKK